MNKIKCNICFNGSRKTKYVTENIIICQWCVTRLKDKPVNPDIIVSQLREIVERHIDAPPSEPDKQIIIQRAENEVASKKSSFQNFLNCFFVSQKRKDEINDVYNTLLNEASHNYNDKLSKYDKEFMINELLEKMVVNNHIPQVVQEVYLKKHSFSSRYYNNKIRVLKDDLTPIDRDYLKYIRAYRSNLIAGESKVPRLLEQDSRKLRSVVLVRDNYACKICGKNGRDEELHVHHIIPLSAYGTNEIANLVTLCYSCHNKQHPGFKVTRSFKKTKKINSC